MIDNLGICLLANLASGGTWYFVGACDKPRHIVKSCVTGEFAKGWKQGFKVAMQRCGRKYKGCICKDPVTGRFMGGDV